MVLHAFLVLVCEAPDFELAIAVSKELREGVRLFVIVEVVSAGAEELAVDVHAHLVLVTVLVPMDSFKSAPLVVDVVLHTVVLDDLVEHGARIFLFEIEALPLHQLVDGDGNFPDELRRKASLRLRFAVRLAGERFLSIFVHIAVRRLRCATADEELRQ